jgi:hypothetical protein
VTQAEELRPDAGNERDDRADEHGLDRPTNEAQLAPLFAGVQVCRGVAVDAAVVAAGKEAASAQAGGRTWSTAA